jgi:anti-sigma B factor antagonist
VTIEENEDPTVPSLSGETFGPAEPAGERSRSGLHLPRHVHMEQTGGVIVLRFDADEAVMPETIEAIGRRLLDSIVVENPLFLVVNLDRVRSLSSATLGKLIGLKKRVRADQGKFRLCGLHPDLLEVFQLTHLDRVFEIYPDERSARDPS